MESDVGKRTWRTLHDPGRPCTALQSRLDKYPDHWRLVSFDPMNDNSTSFSLVLSTNSSSRKAEYVPPTVPDLERTEGPAELYIHLIYQVVLNCFAQRLSTMDDWNPQLCANFGRHSSFHRWHCDHLIQEFKDKLTKPQAKWIERGSQSKCLEVSLVEHRLQTWYWYPKTNGTGSGGSWFLFSIALICVCQCFFAISKIPLIPEFSHIDLRFNFSKQKHSLLRWPRAAVTNADMCSCTPFPNSNSNESVI